LISPWVGTSDRPAPYGGGVGRRRRAEDGARSVAPVLAALQFSGPIAAARALARPLAAAILLSSLACTAAKIGYVYDKAEWPTEAGDFSRTGSLEREAYPPLALHWRTNAGVAPVGQLAVLDDAVAGCFLRRTVAAYALDTGEPIWTRNLRADPASGPSASAGLLYLSTDMPESKLQCISLRDGKTIWIADTGECSGAPTVVGPYIFASTRSGAMLRLNAADGAVHWSTRVARLAGASPSVRGELAVVTTLGDSVVAVAADTGRTVWQSHVGSAQFGAAAVHGERCYVSANNGEAVCLELASGRVLWKRALGGRCVSGPAARGGRVYYTDLSGRLTCFDAASGEELWRWQKQDPFKASPAVTPHFVFTASMGGRLACHDRETGEVLWEDAVEGSFETPPAIAERYLIAVSSRGTLFCYKEEIR